MRFGLLVLLLIFFATGHAQSLKNYFKKQDSLLHEIQVFKSKDNPQVLAVIVVDELDWWEWLAVVKLKEGKVEWQAKFDSIPDEQSIRSVKQVKLKGHSNIFFQVYGETHIGNGSYYMYELKEHEMVLRASTRAVDESWAGDYHVKNDWREYDRIFKHDTLTTQYRDLNGDGLVDIELTGVEEIWRGKSKIKASPARKVLIYNKQNGRFIEDKKKRVGFKQDLD